MKLIYIADPMCSWCYGFGKELSALKAQFPEIALEVIVGGVRAGETEVMDEKMKQFRLSHWARVEKMSGLPFNRDAFAALEGFVYDTEPVCRAVVTSRQLAPKADILAVFRALQHAFYAEGRDTTDGSILAEVAVGALHKQGVELTAEEFLEHWQSSQIIRDTGADFSKARELGVQSFPTLVVERDARLYLLSQGYASGAELAQRLDQLQKE